MLFLLGRFSFAMDEAPTITFHEDHSSQGLELSGGSTGDIIKHMCNLIFAPIKLGKNEQSFTKHISFKEAAKILPPPVMVVGNERLKDFARIDSDKLGDMFDLTSASLIGGILQIKFSDALEYSDKGELMTDKPYLEMLLLKFMPLPNVVYKEIHLAYKTADNVFGGSLDVVVGSKSNGNRPHISIANKDVSVYLGTLCESKSSMSGLMKASNVRKSGNMDDLKTLNQPMLELLAFAQKTNFPSSKVPLLLIYGNRFMFRPLLYFKKYDVMLTTPCVIQHRINQHTMYRLGLALLFTLLNCHHTDVILFHKDVLRTKDKTGFKLALKKSGESYEESLVTLVEPKPKIPLIHVQPMMGTSMLQLPSGAGPSSPSSSESTQSEYTPKPEPESTTDRKRKSKRKKGVSGKKHKSS
jgi:hypothetical protein